MAGAKEGLVIEITVEQQAAINQLKKFTAELNRTTDVERIKVLRAETQRLTQDIQGFASKSAQALNANTTAVKNNATAYMNIGRVIQDLPYGFNGVANNLTQLIPSVGALGLAFSGVVTAITFAQVGFGAWTRGLEGAKKATDDLQDALKEFTESAGKELTTARLLYAATQNVTLSMNQRVKAAKELKDLYPDILSNFSAEDIALGKAAKAYNVLTDSIVANARARAFGDKVAKLEGERLTELENIAKINGMINKQNREAKPSRVIARGGEGYAPLQLHEKVITIQDKINENEKRRAKALGEVEVRLKRINALQAFYEKLAGGATALQKTVIPTKTSNGGRSGGGRPAAAQVDSPFRQLRQGNTIESANPYDPTALKQLGEAGSFYVTVQAQMLQNQDLVNASLEQANFLAEMGAGLFSNMANAFLYGQDMGDALASALKAMVAQLTAAIAKAVILQGVLAIISGGSSVAVGQLAGANIAGTAVQGGGFGRFLLRGADLIMSGQRSGVANTRRRGG